MYNNSETVREDLLVADRISARYATRSSGLFRAQSKDVVAVDNVSFHIASGKTLGLVGESGCGKTTIGRMTLGLIPTSSGSITFEGTAGSATQDSRWRERRKRMQLVHQDPYSALDRRLRIGDQVIEPLEIHRIKASSAERRELAIDMLGRVGLSTEVFNRYPHELSGGQRQRAVLARALILEPKLVVCDEAVSALDVSVQAQVLNLLIDLQNSLDLSYLFISHDLRVVRHISHEVAVMYLGNFVEMGPPELVLDQPLHPYTRALVAAMPEITADRRSASAKLGGELPSLTERPSGCVFHPRCPYADDICRREKPSLELTSDGRKVACHHVSAIQGNAR